MNIEIDNFKEALESNNSLLVFSYFASIVSHIVEYAENKLSVEDAQDKADFDLRSISEIQKRLRAICQETYKHIESGNMDEIKKNFEIIEQNADKIGQLFKKLEIELGSKKKHNS